MRNINMLYYIERLKLFSFVVWILFLCLSIFAIFVLLKFLLLLRFRKCFSFYFIIFCGILILGYREE